LFTPTCLDADSLRYYMESLNWVPLPLPETSQRASERYRRRDGIGRSTYQYVHGESEPVSTDGQHSSISDNRL